MYRLEILTVYVYGNKFKKGDVDRIVNFKKKDR